MTTTLLERRPEPRPERRIEGVVPISARELRFQRCAACGAWRHPPRVLCAACRSDQWSWEPSSGHGEVFTWTVVHQPLHPAFVDDVPVAGPMGAGSEPAHSPYRCSPVFRDPFLRT